MWGEKNYGNRAHDLHFRRSRVNENPVHMALGHVATELKLLCVGEDLSNVFRVDGKKEGGHGENYSIMDFPFFNFFDKFICFMSKACL